MKKQNIKYIGSYFLITIKINKFKYINSLNIKLFVKTL